MRKQIVLLVCLLANYVGAAAWRPTDRMLHAVRFVESSHGLVTWGDNGESLGDYQLSEAAWLDVNAWRKSRALPLYAYETGVWNRTVSRAYAADYLAILHRELKRKLNRPPTAAEVYAAYNMGMGSFAQCQFRLKKVNAITAKKCQQIDAMLASRGE